MNTTIAAEQAASTAADRAAEVVEKVSDELLRYLKDAVEVGKEQVPLVITQYIHKEIWEWSFLLGLWIVIGVSGWLLWSACWKNKDEWDVELGMAGLLIGICMHTMGTIGVLVAIESLVSIWIAPKVFILEKLSYLLKGV